MVSWESLEAFCGPQVFVLGVSWGLLCVLDFLERCLGACSGPCGGVVELLGASRSLFGEYLGFHSGANFDFLRASTPIYSKLICTHASHVLLSCYSCLSHAHMHVFTYVCMYICINDKSQPRHFCLVTAASHMHICMYLRIFGCTSASISQ